MNARFYIGPPCGKGHDGTRYSSNGHCVQCDLAAGKAYYRANKRAPSGRSASRHLDSIGPDKPTNPQAGNGWPFGRCFEGENLQFLSGSPRYVPARSRDITTAGVTDY